jgi:hypothetical protein
MCRAADEPLAPLIACRDISDAAARLACYDRETAALVNAAARPASLAAAPAATAPASGAATPASAAPAPVGAPPLSSVQKFGLTDSAIAANEVSAGLRAAKESKIEARIAGLAMGGNGRVSFTLDNSQVWRQLESDGDLLARLGDTVTISRGLLNSYWLQLKNGRGCKVTRLP